MLTYFYSLQVPFLFGADNLEAEASRSDYGLLCIQSILFPMFDTLLLGLVSLALDTLGLCT